MQGFSESRGWLRLRGNVSGKVYLLANWTEAL